MVVNLRPCDNIGRSLVYCLPNKFLSFTFTIYITQLVMSMLGSARVTIDILVVLA